MSLKLNSSGGGSVTLQEPVTASDLTLNLPATLGGTGNSMAVTSDASGNVGVGVTPSAWGAGLTALQLTNGGSLSTQTGAVLLSQNKVNSGGDKYISNGFASDYYQLNGTHAWRTAPSGTAGNVISFTQAMTLNASGDFMVGTTTSQARGNFVASSLDSGVLYLASNAPNGPGGQIAQINTNGSGAAKYIRVVTSNNWQIVNSTYTAIIFDLTNAGAAFQGNNSSTWSTTSDIRIKTNVRQIGGALDKMMALKPCHFEYKNAIGETTTGFIAQEFEEVFPGHVKESTAPMQFQDYIEGEDKTLKTIDANLVPYLVKAIQELKAELDTVKAELAAMKGTA